MFLEKCLIARKDFQFSLAESFEIKNIKIFLDFITQLANVKLSSNKCL
jgi:hypothetical protein